MVQNQSSSSGFHFDFPFAAMKTKRIVVLLAGYYVFMPLFIMQFLVRLEFCNPLGNVGTRRFADILVPYDGFLSFFHFRFQVGVLRL